MLLAPGGDLEQQGNQVFTALSQVVKFSRSIGWMCGLGDDAALLKLSQPIGKDVCSDRFRTREKLFELVFVKEKEISNDQQSPLVPE